MNSRLIRRTDEVCELDEDERLEDLSHDPCRMGLLSDDGLKAVDPVRKEEAGRVRIKGKRGVSQHCFPRGREDLRREGR